MKIRNARRKRVNFDDIKNADLFEDNVTGAIYMKISNVRVVGGTCEVFNAVNAENGKFAHYTSSEIVYPVYGCFHRDMQGGDIND